jgi:pheromone shutdown-related protein TraB
LPRGSSKGWILMTEQENTDTVTRLTHKGREIILIGTAHISKRSVEEVEEVIRGEMPGRVCIEIDEARFKSMMEGQNWQSLNISEVIRQRKGFLLMANLVLSSFQRRIGTDLGAKQGEEMRRAVEVARELDIPFSFADREIQITLRRAWSRSGFWNKMKLLASLFSSVFAREKLTEEELEKLKSKSALEDMMEELADLLPRVKEVLIDERDQFLAAKISRTDEEKVVAVVGAGHVPGIVRWLERYESGDAEPDVESINSAPPPGKAGKIIPWVIPAVVVGLLALGFFRSGWQEALSMLWMWILVNGTLSALGALIALAHPITIVLSFVAAPITSMNPTIGVGIVTGLIEAYLRKPRVEDFESLHDDITSLKGFYRNRLTHILLVFFFSTVGSAVGTFVGIPYLSSLLL